MKLFLSSLSIPNTDVYRSLFGDIQQPRIAMICNAWGVYSPEKSEPYIRANMGLFTELDMSVEIIDLLEYANKQSDLDDTLSKYDGIWVTGGNTYYLNWAIHQSGLQNIIHKHCDRGLVYGGESAGAVVVGPTLDHFQAMDDPTEAPAVILEGMSLTDVVVVPHSDSEKYSEEVEGIYQALQGAGEDVVRLNDSQALVIDEQRRDIVP